MTAGESIEALCLRPINPRWLQAKATPVSARNAAGKA